MTDSTRLDAERALLAAEYALGLLEGSARAQCEELYAVDPAFAAEVDRWIEEADGWGDGEHDAGPSEESYARIAAAVGLNDEGGAVSPEHEPAPVAANDPGLWRPLAIAASLAAVVFASLWLLDSPAQQDYPSQQDRPIADAQVPPMPDRQEQFSVAQISSDDTTSLVSALYDTDTGTLYVKLSDIPDAERVPQLWLLDSNGTPRSLGFGTRDASTPITLSADLRQIADEGGVLAISLEQPAAVPHETPSDVLGAAQFASLDIAR
ncbi:anti-sigma factor [Aurantiacibacter rhizosphaerae]|uniref:Anti-sigma K factor RskA C-terminal domain-containing protein n=1 Tax=Aurantiacibacter rhizosphaerae TaxID=2691582 RepID=A0A844XDI4_9SPHN|nr:anti-sigma factor [Aurantiacibacter rhizosphaerae]MWV27565.1 hypothetical protein [Aurantiacibacter rhizosphaerae]